MESSSNEFPDMMYLFKCVNKIFCYTLTTIFFLNLSMYSSHGQNFIFKKSLFVGYMKLLLSKTNKQLLRINIDTKFGDKVLEKCN